VHKSAFWRGLRAKYWVGRRAAQPRGARLPSLHAQAGGGRGRRRATPQRGRRSEASPGILSLSHARGKTPSAREQPARGVAPGRVDDGSGTVAA
jgi:hypothetical protein